MTELKTKSISKKQVQIEDCKEYFACDTKHFFIYHKQTKNWKCAVTGLETVQELPKNGALHLNFKGMLLSKGRWGWGETMNNVLDFFNSGDWKQWSQQ